MDDEIEGFILAGGKSSRMGRPKHQLLLGGETLLDRAADALRAISGGRISVVGVGGGSSPGRGVLADPEIVINGERASGAIVGLYGALSAAHSRWIALVACDLPFVDGELFARLAKHRTSGIDAIVPVQSDGRLQPLAALYRVTTCASAALTTIESGDRSMRSLLSSVNTKFIPYNEFSDIDVAGRLFLNVNTPDELGQAVERA